MNKSTIVLARVLLPLGMLMSYQPIPSFADVALTKNFIEGIEDGGFIFSLPNADRYENVKIIKTKAMEYDLAIMSNVVDMEIRYTFRNYTAKEQSVQGVQSAKMFFSTVVLNVAQSDLNYREFDPAEVKNEFKADWGATAVFVPKPEFGGKYNLCEMVGIYRSGRGAVAIRHAAG